MRLMYPAKDFLLEAISKTMFWKELCLRRLRKSYVTKRKHWWGIIFPQNVVLRCTLSQSQGCSERERKTEAKHWIRNPPRVDLKIEMNLTKSHILKELLSVNYELITSSSSKITQNNFQGNSFVIISYQSLFTPGWIQEKSWQIMCRLVSCQRACPWWPEPGQNPWGFESTESWNASECNRFSPNGGITTPETHSEANSPTVPEDHKHSLTPLGKSRGTPQNPAEPRNLTTRIWGRQKYSPGWCSKTIRTVFS